MALTNNASAALSATVAENAAAEAKSYAIKASQAEDFSNKAQASAESAAASAISSQNSAVAAEEAMNIALEQTIATIRVPDGEALSVLPVANERKGKFPGFDPVTGDVQLIDISSTDAASLALSLASTEGSALVGTPSGTVEERFSSIELGLDGKASNDVVATKISGDVTFATGGTLFSEKDFIYNSENFSWYFWSGSFSGSGKVVPPGATPEDTGGVGPSKWVNIGDAALRGALASHDAGRGASLIALTQGGTVQNAITYVTPEMFGAKADLSTDDTSAIASAIAYAGGNPTKGVFFGQKYKINNSANFDVPSGVSVFGAGSESGVVMEGVPVGSLHVIFNLAGKGSCLRDFAIEFTTDGAGSIGAVKTFGVMLQSTSSFCQVYGLKINGKKIGAMGFSHGIRCTGYKNKISNNDIQYCTMGITYRGTGHYITYNYTNNHYLTDGARPWTSASPYWDGITGEGAINCTVAFNTCEENGQSGIYLGGNNSLSYDVIICNNTLRRNWNRGIDTGVSGTPSSINNVLNITISCNNSSDNREPQIWLSDTSNSVVTGNVAKLTDEYNIIFAGFFGASRIGIALNDTGNCKNNIIESNFISTTTSDLFGVTVNGIGHIYRNNRLVGKGDFLSNSVANRLIYNDIGRVVSSFSPQVVSGSGVTVVSSSGAYSIDGQRLFFQISMSLTATSPSGSLVIGYLPGLSSASVLQSNVSIQSYNGFSTSMPGSLEAHQNLDVPDTIFITRTGSGRQNYDVASYVGSNSTILISGSVLVARGF